MISALGIFLALSAALGSASAAVPATVQLRGYEQVNQNLRDRLVAPGTKFELSAYLGPGKSAGLLDLLGTYAGGEGNSSFRNGQPNPVNLLIWYILLDSFAHDAAATCSGGSAITWRPELVPLVTSLCARPTDPALSDFWWALTDFDSPPAELDAWIAFAHSPSLAAMPSERALAALILTAIYNPFFIFQE